MDRLYNNLSREERLNQLQSERAFYENSLRSSSAPPTHKLGDEKMLDEEVEALWIWKTKHARPLDDYTLNFSNDDLVASQVRQDVPSFSTSATSSSTYQQFQEIPSYKNVSLSNRGALTTTSPAVRKSSSLRPSSQSPTKRATIPNKNVLSYAMKSTKETDHPLLLLLRQERQKFVSLETSYHALHSKVAGLQTSHLQELRNEERKCQQAIDHLQHDLDMKTKDAETYRKEATIWKSRFARDARVEVEEVGKLNLELTSIKSALADSTKAHEQALKDIQELRGTKNELLSALGLKEAELKKKSRALQEKDESIIALNQRIIKKDDELIHTSKRVSNLTLDTHALRHERETNAKLYAELDQLKRSNASMKKEMEEILSRERKYLTDIKEAAARESEIYKETKDIVAQHQHLTRDLRDSKAAKEEAEASIRALRQDVEELRKQLTQRRGDYDELQASIPSQIQAAIDRGVAEARSVFTQELAVMQRVIEDLEGKLAREQAQEEELQTAHHQKLLIVGEKIVSLQSALAEAQAQLSAMDKQDTTLRADILSKEQMLSNFEAKLDQITQEKSQLSRALMLEKREVEELIRRRKQEKEAAEEKAVTERSTLQTQIDELQSQLSLKKSQVSQLTQEHRKMNASSDQMGENLALLESRLRALQSSDIAKGKELASCEAKLSRKDQEIHILTLKSESLHEQIALLQEELKAFRAPRPSKDVNKIQNSVSELSKRLKVHVDSLLEAENYRASQSNTPRTLSPQQSFSLPLDASRSQKESIYTKSRSDSQEEMTDQLSSISTGRGKSLTSPLRSSMMSAAADNSRQPRIMSLPQPSIPSNLVNRSASASRKTRPKSMFTHPEAADSSAMSTYRALKEVLGDSFLADDRDRIIAGLEDVVDSNN